MDKPAKKSRPQKRTLVRWTDDIDKRVLVSIQWACADSGVKIPWKKIATQLGPEFTEGAIVQHLAKLRLKMVEMDMEVPPPLKRGTVTKEPSSFYANASRVRKPPTTPTKIKSEEIVQASARSDAKARGRTRKRAEYESDDSSDHDEEYDSDSEEYGRPTKKKPRVAAGGKKGRQNPTLTADVESKTKREKASTIESSNADTPTVKSESTSPNAEDGAGPAMRTRGIKQNYANFGNEDDDDDDEVEEEQAELEQTYGDGQGSDNENDSEERQYSPKNTTNMEISPVDFKTPTIAMAAHRTPTVYSSPNFDYLNSGFINSQGPPTNPYPLMSRGSLSGPSPHSSSFSSSRTASMNSSMMMNHMHPGAFQPTTNQMFSGGLNYADPVFPEANQHTQPNSTFNPAVFTGNNDFDPFLGGSGEMFSGSLGFLNGDLDDLSN